MTPEFTAAVDSSEILPGLLWQSAAPPPGTLLRDSGFNVVALRAYEYQPAAELFPGVEVIHSPSDDDFDNPPTRQVLLQAMACAKQLAEAMKQGKVVLSTCRMGVNRSGLVTALALHKHLGLSGNQAVGLIKSCRPYALSNPQFLRILSKIPASHDHLLLRP